MKQSLEKEALRQVYLQEMDIQVWYPRFKLPHSDTVREYDWLTSAQAASTVAEPAESVQINIAASAGSLERNNSLELEISLAADAREQLKASLVTESKQTGQARLTEALQQEIPRQKIQTTAAPTAESDPEAGSANPLQFAFAYLAVSDSLAVICEIPYQSRGRLQAPIRSLLMRILEALSVQVRPGSTPVIHFHWPLHDAQPQPTHSNQPANELLNQGIDSARQTLHAFLARQLNERPAPFLLIFSEHWPHYLFPADFTPTDTQGLFKHPQFATQVLRTRGLHIMQADDSVKKPVWQQLQVLKTQIKRLKNAVSLTTDLSADAQDDSVRPPKDEY